MDKPEILIGPAVTFSRQRRERVRRLGVSPRGKSARRRWQPKQALPKSDIPARLDRLPWGRFHSLVVAALGITWILDGLEVTLAGALSGALKQSPILHFSNTDIGLASSAYLAGAVLGAMFFGWLTDRLGRKKLFFITLSVYLVATAATATSWDIFSFALFRFITGAGIGGEYAAINSTIQELIPARVRGWSDLVINGSFWIGAALGALGSLVLLDPAVIDPEIGWRLAFLIGASLALVIFFMRLWIPESPRWLMTHGRTAGGRARDRRHRSAFSLPHAEDLPRVRLRMRYSTPLREVAQTLFKRHRQRTLVGLSLMASQAFFYNAIFFTYALILTDFYGIASDQVGWYLLPFAAGNFLGPVSDRPIFRHHRPAADDRLHLHHLRRAAGGHRLSVRARPDHRGDADAVLDGDLLLCLRRGELGLSHGERNLPAGNPRAGDRILLCRRHRHRRHRRAVAVRRADRQRFAR